jgi:hypothetical protein
LRQFPAGISGIQGSRWFDQQDFALFFGAGLVLHSFGDDHHSTGFQVQAFVAQVFPPNLYIIGLYRHLWLHINSVKQGIDILLDNFPKNI